MSTRTPGPPGQLQRVISPGEGRKSRSGSSALIRTSIGGAGERDLVLADRERLAAGDAQLLLDEVDAGDELGHRMLDLDARVHLDEVEAPRRGRAGTRPCPRSRSPLRAAMPQRGAGHGVARCRRRAPETATPRAASAGGAGASTRARRGGPGCRARRRAPAPRRDARRRAASRGTATPSPNAASASLAACARSSASSSSSRAARIPRPPPPAAALIITG